VTSHRNKSLLIPAGVGLAVFVGLHVFFVMTWERLFAWGGVHEGWWLNSGKSVEWTLVTLFFAALAVLSRSGAPVRGAVAMWVGVLVGMVFVMVASNWTDSPWPILLVMGGALTGVAVSLGMAAAVGLKAIFQSPSGK
jgi:hypothetical protein